MTATRKDRRESPDDAPQDHHTPLELDKPTGRRIGWEPLETHYPYVDVRFRVRRDRVRLPNGNEIDYTYMETKGALWIVPFTDDGKIILIRQYRYPTDDWRWEVPAGGLHDHDGPLEELARRELAQEIGATCDELIYVNWYYGAASASNTVCHVMLARGTRLDREPKREETEFIEIHPLPVDEALSRARSGRLRDGRSALALLLCEALLKGKA
jgi:ADP-ribose pyrophosphatase